MAEGHRVVDPQIAVAAVMGAGADNLTNRELEVLELAAEGAPVSEIARTLYLSLGTVRNYLSAATAKTGARNRVDAIRIARQAGWLL
jgi:two-component system response regulator DesR